MKRIKFTLKDNSNMNTKSDNYYYVRLILYFNGKEITDSIDFKVEPFGNRVKKLFYQRKLRVKASKEIYRKRLAVLHYGEQKDFEIVFLTNLLVGQYIVYISYVLLDQEPLRFPVNYDPNISLSELRRLGKLKRDDFVISKDEFGTILAELIQLYNELRDFFIHIDAVSKQIMDKEAGSFEIPAEFIKLQAIDTEEEPEERTIAEEMDTIHKSIEKLDFLPEGSADKIIQLISEYKDLLKIIKVIRSAKHISITKIRELTSDEENKLKQILKELSAFIRKLRQSQPSKGFQPSAP
ncbi:hypothetical protein JXB41_05185 [Candidatus Woesearchaeota archaeon]|nr:hypothetical protein [Candidatus Woesearchaeota archaeon]